MALRETDEFDLLRKRAETKNFGIDAVTTFNTLCTEKGFGAGSPITVAIAKDAASGKIACPDCGGTDIDPMVSTLWCGDCGNAWLP